MGWAAAIPIALAAWQMYQSRGQQKDAAHQNMQQQQADVWGDLAKKQQMDSMVEELQAPQAAPPTNAPGQSPWVGADMGNQQQQSPWMGIR